MKISCVGVSNAVLEEGKGTYTGVLAAVTAVWRCSSGFNSLSTAINQSAPDLLFRFTGTHSSDHLRDPLSTHSTAPQHPWLPLRLSGADSKRSIARGIAPIDRSGLVSGINGRKEEGKERTLSRPTVVARTLRERVSCGWRMRWAASIADIVDGDEVNQSSNLSVESSISLSSYARPATRPIR
jgi:hypothetical protein